MARDTSANSRLSVDDWIQAGYALIADEGLQALKIDRLCAQLNVTKGSFYWHFPHMAGYRSALIDTWAERRDDDRDESHELPPRERLSQMMRGLVSPRHWKLERAMREWARTDGSVAAGVQTADRRVLKRVRQAFVDLGFSDEQASLRAHTTFAAGIGFLQLAGARTQPLSAAQREGFLDLMLADQPEQ